MRRWFRNFLTLKSGVGIALLLTVLSLAVLAGSLTPYRVSESDLRSRLEPPNWAQAEGQIHLLGTDALGRDVLTRVMYGARVSLLVGFVAVVISGVVGMSLGLLAGFSSGWVDALIMRLVDIQLALPMIIFAIAWVAFMGAGIASVIFIIAVWGWVKYARFTRSMVLSIRETQFIEASRALGAPDGYVMFRHVAPNVLGPVVVLATLQLGEAVLLEAALSFLGIGINPPTPTWGGMIAEARSYIDTAWWTALFPGVAIVMLVLGANLTGDALRDALDPTTEG